MQSNPTRRILIPSVDFMKFSIWQSGDLDLASHKRCHEDHSGRSPNHVPVAARPPNFSVDPVRGEMPNARLMAWLSDNLDRRRTEKFVLYFSAVWIAVMTAVTFTGAFKHWGEWQHMALGLVLSVPIWAYGLKNGHAARFNLLIAIHTLIQCYFGSELFFEAFGMEYHFHTRLLLNGTPVFLYLVTIAYFSTYYVLMIVLWRRFRTRNPNPGPIATTVVRALLSYSVAFAETAVMANDFLSGYFSYRDPRFVMIWGSIAYGTIFFITLPLFYNLDEPGAKPLPVREAAWYLLALNMLCLGAYEVYGAVLV
jgi:hypothetical protein